MKTFHTFRPDGNKTLKRAIDDLAKHGMETVQVFSNQREISPSDYEGWWILASKEVEDAATVRPPHPDTPLSTECLRNGCHLTRIGRT